MGGLYLIVFLMFKALKPTATNGRSQNTKTKKSKNRNQNQKTQIEAKY